MYLLRCGKGKDNHNRKGRQFYSAPSSVEFKKMGKINEKRLVLFKPFSYVCKVVRVKPLKR
jgi:hypothetical protein